MRTTSLSAVLALCVLCIAIIAPIQAEKLIGINGDNATATGEIGDSITSTLTFTSTNTTASVNLVVGSENGTFATSTDGTNNTIDQRAKFSISTNNATGYTVTLTASGSDTNLTSASGGGSGGGSGSGASEHAIASISSTTSASDFTDTGDTGKALNNMWGYIPNYYNSVLNTDHNYYPAPTSSSEATIRTTSTANSVDGVSNADEYTIGLGLRADYTSPSGTYTNNTFIIQYVANSIAYEISFSDDTSDGSVANLPSTIASSTTETSVALPTTIPTRTGYTFKAWCLGTVSSNGIVCTGTEYAASTNDTPSYFGINQTLDNTNTILYATWTANTYTITLNQNGATTSGSSTTTATYNATTLGAITLPRKRYTVSGFSTSYNNAANASVSSTTTITSTYDLDGWYTASSGGTKVASNSTVPALQASVAGYTNSNARWTRTSSATLYAHWSNANAAVTLPTITKTGYICGWSTSTSTNTITYESGGSMTPSSNTTLYGVCNANTYTLTINFAGTGVSSVQVRTASGTSGTLKGTVSTSGGSVSGLTYDTAYYLYPTFDANYKLDSWSNTGSYGTLSCTSSGTCSTDTNPTFTMGAGDGAVTVTGVVSLPDPSTLTDLTGTTWYFNALLLTKANGGVRYLDFPFGFDYIPLNFTNNDISYSGMQQIVEGGGTYCDLIYDDGGDQYSNIKYEMSDFFNINHWTDETYRTISITGGTSATNSTFINWLRDNATLIGYNP